ncbi:MAG: cation-translocating P-type ATPase [Oscillospiraceae bacterium]|jgi:Ca2+-transporting ATPase|nr:cation-translocating P-type ATPase [Oscillospiraceae bacterium]
MAVYTEEISALLGRLETSGTTGLSAVAAQERLEKYGSNTLKGEKHKNFFQKFLAQLKDYMVIILIIAAAISFALALIEQSGDFIDSIVIMGIVILNALLGVFQESSAEKALDALKNMSAPFAKIIRDGVAKKIPSSEIVPGDLILLESGDFIPADARLIESASLKCEESALTGESVPAEKDAAAKIAEDAPLGDRINMIYSGCSVAYGRAKAIVTGTGMGSEMGKIAGLLNAARDETTPLQQRLNKLGKNLGILSIIICVFIFILGLFQGQSPVLMFMTAVSLAVAAIPEGLTTVVTLVLSMGVRNMVKRNAIVRRLPAVETLGSTSVICSDKTGTLTQNKMTVMQVWAAGGEICAPGADMPADALKILEYGALCNDGKVQLEGGKETHIGDPTETAIVAAARLAGLDKSGLDSEFRRVAELPFDSDRKLMTTVNMIDGKPYAIVKGGFDVLLPRCASGDSGRAEEVNLSMSGKALRVLAVAFKLLERVPENPSGEELENGLEFAGLIGMIDPPREESRQAIAKCKKAGIKTVMITGDHIVTASAIAKELGILEDGDEAISGRELAMMDEGELAEKVRQYSVYARVSPEDKIKIVRAWQDKGEVVAMTGDGVNDAPALKAADIGCAMGITGTDVAKGAADMVLTDDNFSTIVAAVDGGRAIYDNIKKTIEFLLGSNIGEVLTVFLAMLFGWGSPLLAIQILMVNVVTDAFPAFALGFEPAESDVMERPPIRKNESVFAGGLIPEIIIKGVVVTLCTLAAFWAGARLGHGGISPSEEAGRTMAFLALSLSQLVYAVCTRSRKSLFVTGLWSNMQMIYSFLISLAVILLVTLVPPFNFVFKMAPLVWENWALVSGLALVPFVVSELVKLIKNRPKFSIKR